MAKIRTLPLPKKGRKKCADGGGLSLFVSPSGGKAWYLRNSRIKGNNCRQSRWFAECRRTLALFPKSAMVDLAMAVLGGSM